jgi:hypothetical protein
MYEKTDSSLRSLDNFYEKKSTASGKLLGLKNEHFETILTNAIKEITVVKDNIDSFTPSMPIEYQYNDTKRLLSQHAEY